MSGYYDVGEHDVLGVTVCFVRDCRTGQIVADGLYSDEAEAIADGMNEQEYQREEEEASQR